VGDVKRYETLADDLSSSGALGKAYRPVRAPGTHPDVKVPLEQSLITASLKAALPTVTTLFATSILFGGAGVITNEWQWYVGVVIAIMLSCVVFTLFLFRYWPGAWELQRDATSRSIYAIEDTIGVDLNRDKVIGKPEKQYITVQNYRTQPTVSTVSNLPDSDIVSFIAECFNSGKRGIDHFEAKGWERDKYNKIVDVLTKANVIEYGKARHDGKRPAWRFREELDSSDKVITVLFPNAKLERDNDWD